MYELTAERMDMVNYLSKLAEQRAELSVLCVENVLRGADIDEPQMSEKVEKFLSLGKQLLQYLESLDDEELHFLDMLIDLGCEQEYELRDKEFLKKEATLAAVIADIAPLHEYLQKGVEKLLLQ